MFEVENHKEDTSKYWNSNYWILWPIEQQNKY
jgi:hypothetical protein